MIYYVKKNSCASEELGTEYSPFSTISQAADIARAGDMVLIGEGIYREWVSPVCGGTPDSRIVYKNIDGEKPVIRGSEVVDGWKSLGDNIYIAVVPRSFFGAFCPFEIEMFGDWYEPMGQIHHIGEVFADGEALYEAASLETIKARDKDAWFSVIDGENVVFYIYMKNRTPDKCEIEVSARPFGFFPREESCSYITVSGLTVENTATQWAPPTAFQGGAIGAHWSKGWIIENCTVRNSKCVGISIGKRHDEDDNLWSRDPRKGGAQTYTEIIFRNLARDWNKDTVGGHIIRNCTISDCGQAGIVGCMGGAFSIIEGNLIHDINNREEFEGSEMAGIKLHAGIDTIIKNNVIHDCSCSGIWLDWETQGSRVTSNIMFRNIFRDIFIEVSHGPTIIDNNILLSDCPIYNVSQGTAIIHNIMGQDMYLRSEPNRFTMYHLPHSTSVLGSMIIMGGNDRVYNNLYLGGNAVLGSSCYNGYNTADYIADTSQDDTQIGAKNDTLGVDIRGNAYCGGAKAWEHEADALVLDGEDTYCRVVCENGDYYLDISFNEEIFNHSQPIVTTEMLGVAFQPNVPFENADETPLTVDKDLFGNSRVGSNFCGAFAKKFKGRIKICSC